jgi:hypothetical protein
MVVDFQTSAFQARLHINDIAHSIAKSSMSRTGCYANVGRFAGKHPAAVIIFGVIFGGLMCTSFTRAPGWKYSVEELWTDSVRQAALFVCDQGRPTTWVHRSAQARANHSPTLCRAPPRKARWSTKISGTMPGWTGRLICRADRAGPFSKMTAFLASTCRRPKAKVGPFT